MTDADLLRYAPAHYEPWRWLLEMPEPCRACDTPCDWIGFAGQARECQAKRAEAARAVAMAQPEPIDWLGRAYELARARWAADPAMLRRVDRALGLARAGKVWDKGGGKWWVACDLSGVWTVNGAACTCPDYTYRRGGWCKHRIAVALVRRAAELKKAAEGADTPPATEPAPERTDPQAQDTTKPAQRQPQAIALTVEYATDEARERPRIHDTGRLLAFHADGQEAQAPAQDLGSLYRWLAAQGYTPTGFAWLGKAIMGKRQRRQYYTRPADPAGVLESLDRALEADHPRGSAVLVKS